MHQCSRNCGHAENCDANDQCRAPSETIAKITTHGAAHRHSRQSYREDRRKCAACHVPFSYERGNGKTENLYIKAVENNGNGRQRGHQFLIP